MSKLMRFVVMMGVCSLFVVGIVAQEEPEIPEEPVLLVEPVPVQPQEEAIPVFEVPSLYETDSLFSFATPAPAMPNVLLPAQTQDTFYWPFQASDTGTIYNLPDTAYTRSTLGIAACPPKDQRGSFGTPYCYAGNRGLDVNLPQTGEAVLAARSGVVIEVRNTCTHTGIVSSQPSNCPGGGTLSWEYGNFLRMRHDDGSFTVYAHLRKDSMVFPNENVRIEVGSQIALVGNTGNINQPRLYFEFRDSSGNAIDPFERGLWVEQDGVIVSAANALSGDPSKRIGALLGDNTLLVKEGSLAADWKTESMTAIDFELAGSRMAVLDTTRNLYIKEGSLTSSYQLVSGDLPAPIRSFDLEGDRIGVLLENNQFYIKTGTLTNAWSLESNTVQAMQLHGTRIAVMDTANDLYVREGTGGYTLLREDIQGFQMEGNRIGALTLDNVLWVKEGALDAGWVQQSGSVASFQLSGDRIAFQDIFGNLYAKAGTLVTAFNLLIGDVFDFQLEGDRIGVLQTDNDFRVKEGDVVSAQWRLESNTAVKFQLANDRISVLDRANGLYVKEGSLTAGYALLRDSRVVDLQIAERPATMVKPLALLVDPSQLTLNQPEPGTTLSNSHGHPIYEWPHVKNAISYQIYLASADDLLDQRFFGYIPAVEWYCRENTCRVDLTKMSPFAWLPNGNYQLFLKASSSNTAVNGGWTGIQPEFKFTVQEPIPAVVTPQAPTNTNTLTPTINWTLDGTAQNIAFFQLYVAPLNNLTQPAINTWVERELVCGGRDGVSCSVQTPVLMNNTQYVTYFYGWGPGGFTQGGIGGAADGWIQGPDFTVSQ